MSFIELARVGLEERAYKDRSLDVPRKRRRAGYTSVANGSKRLLSTVIQKDSTCSNVVTVEVKNQFVQKKD